MQQKSAFFVPFKPGHKSYNSEGGPYGTCTAYDCFPSQTGMEETNNLASFCFFWDGKDHTVMSGGGLHSRGLVKRIVGSGFKKDDEQENELTATDDKTSAGNDLNEDNKESKKTTTDQTKTGNSDTSLQSAEDTTSEENKNKEEPKKETKKEKGTEENETQTKENPASGGDGDGKSDADPKEDNSKGGDGDDDNSSSSQTSTTLPKAPGKVVIPIPMICPSNLANCYSQNYFEPGGKLQVYANLVPTYAGPWFPPKGKDHHALFCEGINLGCEAPTMRNLQSHRIEAQKCDVAKCKKQSSGR